MNKFLIALAAILLFNFDATSQVARKISDYGEGDLKVSIKLDEAGIHVTNNENMILKGCKMDLNGSVFSSGYLYYPLEIKPGKSLSVKLNEFKSDEGKLIQPEEEAPVKISMSCEFDSKDLKVFTGRF